MSGYGRSLPQIIERAAIIGGIPTRIVEFHTSHGVNTPVGQCVVILAAPVPAHVVKNAEIEIHSRVNDETGRVFWGRIRVMSPEVSDRGRFARIEASGWCYRLTSAEQEDFVYDTEALGADPVAGDPAPVFTSGTSGYVTIESGVKRIGFGTINNYAIPYSQIINNLLPTYTPSVSASFIQLKGRAHGVNTYSGTNLDPTDLSTVEVYSGLTISVPPIGMAVLPTSDDDPAANYSQDTDWEDFELVVPCAMTAGMPYTIVINDGSNPATGAPDDFELKNIQIRTSGVVKLSDIMRGVLKARGFGAVDGPPALVAEIRAAISGVPLRLGGNPAVDSGRVRIPAGDSWLDWSTSLMRLFGYRLFDCPDGATRISQIRGKPGVSDSSRTFTEGVNGTSFTPREDIDQIVTAWKVYGASGTTLNGDEFGYDSYTTVPAASPYVDDPPGVIWGEEQDSRLTSTTYCTLARQVLEINNGGVWTEVTWETWGAPRLQPGDVVTIISETAGYNGPVWVMDVNHDSSENGSWTTCRGWVGNGVPLPGAHTPTTVVPTPPPPPSGGTAGTIHVGNKQMPDWETPTPMGLSVDVGITLANTYTGMTLVGEMHDVTDLAKVGDATASPSRIEVWQDGAKRGTARLPGSRSIRQPATYTWLPFTLPVSGQVHAGAATLRVIAGQRASDGVVDDYEVRGLQLLAEGEGNPAGPRSIRGPSDPVRPPSGRSYQPRSVPIRTPRASKQQQPQTTPRRRKAT